MWLYSFEGQTQSIAAYCHFAYYVFFSVKSCLSNVTYIYDVKSTISYCVALASQTAPLAFNNDLKWNRMWLILTTVTRLWPICIMFPATCLLITAEKNDVLCLFMQYWVALCSYGREISITSHTYTPHPQVTRLWPICIMFPATCLLITAEKTMYFACSCNIGYPCARMDVKYQLHRTHTLPTPKS